MKKHTAILVISAVTSLFLLAACTDATTTPASTKTNTIQSSLETIKNAQNSTLNIITTTETISIGETDKVALQGALKLQDPTYCEKISTKELQEKCKIEVNDNVKKDEAKLKNDPMLCLELSSKDKQDACKLDLEISQKMKEQNREPTDEEMSTYTKAVDSKNIKLCDDIAHKDVRDSCVSSLAMGNTQQ